MRLLFATSNQNKAKEIASLLPDSFEIITLKDIDIKEDIPETSETIEGNALQKSQYIVDHFQLNCFADDTGLEVSALDGEPGVHSARYAGEQRNDDDNMNLLLGKLTGIKNRSARFKTVISLQLDGHNHLFEGIVEGEIIEQKRGTHGFGYDPIFVPKGSDKTFAEMTLEEKNENSHRARAFQKLIEFLRS